jgi:hypothetical protein
VVDLQGAFEFQADVSPDGARLLLRVDDEGRKQGTWVVGAGRKRTAHVAGPGKPVAGGAADLAPDGRRFVLTGKRAGERFLRPDGSELARLALGREAAFRNWLP